MPVCPSCRALSSPGAACPSCGHAFAIQAAAPPAFAPMPAATVGARPERPGLVTGLAVVQASVGILALLVLLVMLPFLLLTEAVVFAFTGEHAGFWADVALLAVILTSGMTVTGFGLLAGQRWAWMGSLILAGGLVLINLGLAVDGDLSRMLVVGLLVGGIVLLLQDSVKEYCGVD